jgi:hypothetical protein
MDWMLTMTSSAGLAAVLAVTLVVGSVVFVSADAPAPDEATLRRMTARFAPVDIGTDVSKLSATDRRVLGLLVEASRVMDALFLRQAWAGNESLLLELVDESRRGDALAKARLDYFLINKGPWSRLDHDTPFVPGVGAKPGGANFYPAGASKEDVERWIATLPAEERAHATGFFWTIRHTQPGSAQPFVLVPYSQEYQGELSLAAELLREAASLTTQPTLRRFLETRAAAFLSNEYYDSDVAWMELDAPIEPTIGPYEVYEDGWFNYKAAYESFITVRDEAESEKLARFSAELQDIENHLPIDPALRNPSLGALAPIRVVNVVFTAGDGNRGVQTAAYNLPNDERVVQEKGSKRVMLKNVQEAKFSVVLQPIARVALAPADQSNVSFDAFFTHILMHELMHGLGPHRIRTDGRETTVRQELKDTYSTIEEAKADISGLWALQYLLDHGKLPASLQQSIYTTFLASAFRSIRFGVTEAHGRGIAIQLNALLDAGAFRAGPDGTFSVDQAKIRDAVASLTREIMTLQAEGSYTKAKALIDRLGTVRPEVQRVLDKLADVPVDIAPRFTTAEQLEQDVSASR